MTDVKTLEARLKANPQNVRRTKRLYRLTDAEILNNFAWESEKAVAPVVTRDAVLALLEEAKASKRRDRWTLGFVAASTVVVVVNAVLAFFA
jgi:hypothetical protein